MRFSTYIHKYSRKGPTLILKHKKESKCGYLIRFINLISYKQTALMLAAFQSTFVSNLVKNRVKYLVTANTGKRKVPLFFLFSFIFFILR